MALNLFDNLSYNGPKPDFTRQEYRTFEDMKRVPDVRMPQLYLAYCLEDQNVYLYNKDNEIDSKTGKFRVFLDIDDIQKVVMPAASSAVLGKVYQYVGTSDNMFKTGFFYKCGVSSGVYYWEEVVTCEPYTIPLIEIDNLFEREMTDGV